MQALFRITILLLTLLCFSPSLEATMAKQENSNKSVEKVQKIKNKKFRFSIEIPSDWRRLYKEGPTSFYGKESENGEDVGLFLGAFESDQKLSLNLLEYLARNAMPGIIITQSELITVGKYDMSKISGFITDPDSSTSKLLLETYFAFENGNVYMFMYIAREGYLDQAAPQFATSILSFQLF